MGAVQRYPFGEPVGSVTALGAAPARVFVLGVYPSAIHARWVGPDGTPRIRAVAVADEPEPFWPGDDAVVAATVARLNARLPSAAGQLEPAAPAFNGPSGLALDEFVLAPLGLDRDAVRIADVHNRYMANTGQVAAVARAYEPLVAAGLLPAVSWERRHKLRRVPSDRQPSLADELATADPEWLITLGNEPLRALGLEPLTQDGYGKERTATVFGRRVRLVPLVHTRQAAGHGASSGVWRERHQAWLAGPALAWLRQNLAGVAHRPPD
jgi:hypothetical protein